MGEETELLSDEVSNYCADDRDNESPFGQVEENCGVTASPARQDEQNYRDHQASARDQEGVIPFVVILTNGRSQTTQVSKPLSKVSRL